MANIHDHHMGRRVTVHATGPGVPRRRLPTLGHPLAEIPPGMHGLVTDVESHGNAPYTRYTVELDDWSWTHGLCPDHFTWAPALTGTTLYAWRLQRAGAALSAFTLTSGMRAALLGAQQGAGSHLGPVVQARPWTVRALISRGLAVEGRAHPDGPGTVYLTGTGTRLTEILHALATSPFGDEGK